ncbi:hypothetical protein ACTJJ4_07695 [Microbacterium sp. 22195]|uniref:hypothetical protein n=1 Tax=Microbacterium sp. 22195 TaxID=3453891 RepID=UPI003F82D5AD
MITAEKQGRNLVLTMEGVDQPFVIRPLPGHAGRQITDTYLATMGGRPDVDLLAALQMAVDGAILDGERWVPRPEAEQENFNRIGMELSQDESEQILMPAFFWQTILGMDGVRAYIEGGEGLAGTLKASGALSVRLGLLVPRTSPSSD